MKMAIILKEIGEYVIQTDALTLRKTVSNQQLIQIRDGVKLGCIHLLNTRKYWDNTRKYCGNTHEQFWCILKLVVDHYFEIDFQSWFLLKNLQNCFKTYKYCDNTREYCICRWTHCSSIGSILVSITIILSSDGSNTILSNIDRTRTSLFEHRTNSNMFLLLMMELEHPIFGFERSNIELRT